MKNAEVTSQKTKKSPSIITLRPTGTSDFGAAFNLCAGHHAKDARHQKAKVEAEKEAIFLELKAKEERRRAEDEYKERLRNELQQEEFEEEQRAKEEAERIKREQDRLELLRAKEY